MQNTLDNLATSFGNLHLEFNSTKSKTIIFSRKRHPSIKTLTIDKQPIQIVDHIKLLGVTIDSKLSFKQHINDLQVACINDIKILNLLTCGRYGVHPDVALQVYKGLIRSKLDY